MNALAKLALELQVVGEWQGSQWLWTSKDGLLVGTNRKGLTREFNKRLNKWQTVYEGRALELLTMLGVEL